MLVSSTWWQGGEGKGNIPLIVNHCWPCVRSSSILTGLPRFQCKKILLWLLGSRKHLFLCVLDASWHLVTGGKACLTCPNQTDQLLLKSYRIVLWSYKLIKGTGDVLILNWKQRKKVQKTGALLVSLSTLSWSSQKLDKPKQIWGEERELFSIEAKSSLGIWHGCPPNVHALNNKTNPLVTPQSLQTKYFWSTGVLNSTRKSLKSVWVMYFAHWIKKIGTSKAQNPFVAWTIAFLSFVGQSWRLVRCLGDTFRTNAALPEEL